MMRRRRPESRCRRWLSLLGQRRPCCASGVAISTLSFMDGGFRQEPAPFCFCCCFCCCCLACCFRVCCCVLLRACVRGMSVPTSVCASVRLTFSSEVLSLAHCGKEPTAEVCRALRLQVPPPVSGCPSSRTNSTTASSCSNGRNLRCRRPLCVAPCGLRLFCREAFQSMNTTC